ncbi:MAG: ABC transporter permease [Anaerolineaceae bacterium]|nr:ABC transporter permease [Anaerolineaceae bacterium]
MNITTLIREALNSITSNKVRSFLTMLGIFIGVGAVIAMMSIGEGAQNSITNSLSALGTQTLYLTPGNFTENVRNAQNLTNDDVAAISRLDCVEIVAPTISQTYTISQSNGKTVNAGVAGHVPGYLTVGNYEMKMGSFITQENIDNKEMVAVIGTEINKSLFGSENYSSVGETIRIMGQPYRVIGVLAEKGSSSLGVSQDRSVFIPLSTAQSRLMTRQKNSVSQVSILIKTSYTLEQAQTMIEDLMQERHNIFEGNPNDFTIMNVQEILNAVGDIMGTFTLFLGGVAAISLLVGGIGIMNIMLVTVTERTREIGLRKALGAKKGDILAQFLVESSVLSLVGGILGIIFGLLLAFGIARIAAMTGTELAISINPGIVLGATLFSIAVGLFFGVYPANKASNLEPVIALRSE